MKKETISYLLEKYISNSASNNEVNKLFEALNANKYDEESLLRMLDEMANASQADPLYSPEQWKPVIREILKTLPAEEEIPAIRRMFSWTRVAAAAAVLILLGTGSYYLFFNKTTLRPFDKLGAQGEKNDVAAGGNKAILTLGNGKTIILDSAHNGLLAQQGNANIIKTDSGKLAYNVLNEKSGTQPGEVQYNVLTTPMGGQFQLTLPDGSQVWLNAASSIKYPTAFRGKERNVEITGEAYFEVSKDKSKPFHVKVNDTEVEVLGTHFNINSYSDEAAVKTTLLEGSVKVTKNTTAVAASSGRQPQSVILAPGQQAQSDRQQQIKIVKDADLDQVMAWKKGLFNFNGSDLHAVMRQLGRWYDIKVDYEGSVPDIIFKGKMYRNVNLSDVLGGFQKMGVKFRLEKGKLVVTG